jgi:hypothetical protein
MLGYDNCQTLTRVINDKPPPHMVEASIHDEVSIGNLSGTKISIKLGLNFGQLGTNNAMIHVLVLSEEE